MRTEYRIVNVSVLAALVLCFIAILAVNGCGVSSCWMRAVYGKDCPLCGCTRDVLAILSGRRPTLNQLSTFLFVGLAIELVWRFLASILTLGSRTIRIDIVLHALLIIVFLGMFLFRLSYCSA